MISPDEYVIRLIDLPPGVGGFIAESPDGFANIYINARYGHNGQHRAFVHELKHAENDDLHSAEPLNIIEARADGRDPRLNAIQNLIRARDLIPATPKHTPSPNPTVPRLTHRQRNVLVKCLAELDAAIFSVWDI